MIPVRHRKSKKSSPVNVSCLCVRESLIMDHEVFQANVIGSLQGPWNSVRACFIQSVSLPLRISCKERLQHAVAL